MNTPKARKKTAKKSARPEERSEYLTVLELLEEEVEDRSGYGIAINGRDLIEREYQG